MKDGINSCATPPRNMYISLGGLHLNNSSMPIFILISTVSYYRIALSKCYYKITVFLMEFCMIICMFGAVADCFFQYQDFPSNVNRLF